MKVAVAMMTTPSWSTEELRDLVATATTLGRGEAEVNLLLCGDRCRAAADEGAALGASVFVFESEACRLPNSDFFSRSVGSFCDKTPVDFVIMPRGIHYLAGAAAAAVALKGRLIPAVDAIGIEKDTYIFTRSTGNGTLLIKEKVTGGPLVLTLEPGAMKSEELPRVGTGQIRDTGLPVETAFEPYEQTREESNRDMDDAEVIVAVGRGIGSEDNLYLVRDLAALFPAAAARWW